MLLDSEQVWDRAKRELVDERGGAWTATASRDMLGMSSTEWSLYMRDELKVPLEPPAIDEAVVGKLLAAYERDPPFLPGARDAVERIAARWPLGLASSSNRVVIDTVLDALGVRDRFVTTVSSEEVARGKPAPDVYLEAARRLAVDPARAVAIEDSENGIRSAHAAGMRVVALPNPHFPPGDDALAFAAVTLRGLDGLTPEAVDGR
ncbi:MAG TPA: HAD family phosphatase [Solirubrobacteraceae bacterium]|nr:HAD family phosphatase [Solirubrobacteraceae bacterium]